MCRSCPSLLPRRRPCVYLPSLLPTHGRASLPKASFPASCGTPRQSPSPFGSLEHLPLGPPTTSHPSPSSLLLCGTAPPPVVHPPGPYFARGGRAPLPSSAPPPAWRLPMAACPPGPEDLPLCKNGG
uniref:Uncharacterized protein n=1 Tax=Triticum urartu TaxID=4572 RepID=A0A8R7QRR7_TRIUA